MKTFPLLIGLACLMSGFVRADEFEKPPILYSQAVPHNPVSRLESKLNKGKATLEYDAQFGFLPALLRELDVPQSSQTLVFSKTSLQRDRITPETPRALYFSDDMYIGYCQRGEVLEISAVDPRLGTAFYTLSQNREKPLEFIRQTDHCLTCHATSNTQGVPGHVLRSVFPDRHGLPILSSGTYRTDHTSPFERRRGGWYVTGTHESHLANSTFTEENARDISPNSGACNVTDLSKWIEPSAYLTPHSDAVALLVLEHQAQGHNLITKASFETREALHYEAQLNRELNEPATKRWNSTTVRIKSAGDALVKYLLFSGEAPLGEPVTGTSDFAAEFSARGPRDRQGRSLRDLDLKTRTFKYPCSFLVYTDSFASLPAEMRAYVAGRLKAILSGEDKSSDFAHLTPADRQAIREILEATKPDVLSERGA